MPKSGQKWTSICEGSGKSPLAQVYRSKHYHGARVQCHHCFKDVAVTPAGKVLQKHSATPRKKKNPIVRSVEQRDALYVEMYDTGLAGDGGIRPSHDFFKKNAEAWIMGYMDGLADGGHFIALAELEKWLSTFEGMLFATSGRI